MAVDPPYRFDPLQNPVDVKWGDEGPVEPHGWRPIGPQHFGFLIPPCQADAGFLILHPNFVYPDGIPGNPGGIVHFDEQDWIFIE